MNFYAFDSFQGIPKNDEQDATGSQWYREGIYSYGEPEFLRNIRRTGADMTKLISIPGFFSESLNSTNPLLATLRRAAIVWIDCNLYSSTREVLNFLIPYLQYGTIISSMIGSRFAAIHMPASREHSGNGSIEIRNGQR